MVGGSHAATDSGMTGDLAQNSDFEVDPACRVLLLKPIHEEGVSKCCKMRAGGNVTMLKFVDV